MQNSALQPGSSLRWFLINWAGVSLYWGWIPWVFDSQTPFANVVQSLTVGGFGLFVGWIQSQELPDFLANERRAWVVYSTAGGIIGLVLGFVAVYVIGFLFVLAPAVYGLSIGAMQSLVLRRKVPNSGCLWVTVTAAGYFPIGLALMLASTIWDGYAGNDMRGILTFAFVGMGWLYAVLLVLVYKPIMADTRKKKAP